MNDNQTNSECLHQQKLSTYNVEIEEFLGIPLLTNEFTTLLHVFLEDGISIKQAMLKSKLSDRAFTSMLTRLKDMGIVEYETHPDDRRVRRLHLSSKAHKIMQSYWDERQWRGAS
jgi:DNA-binding MarR family transcriptional regulator